MLSITVNTNLREVFKMETEEVVLPTSEGFVGVMTDHLPMICKLSFGELKVKNNDGYHVLVIGGGMVEVNNNQVTVLVPYAENVEDIDLDRALKAKERAEKRINDQREELDLVRAMVALQRALLRIRLASSTKSNSEH